MSQTELDIIDKKLLDIIQTAFPLVPRPYAALGEQRTTGTSIEQPSPVSPCVEMMYLTLIVALRPRCAAYRICGFLDEQRFVTGDHDDASAAACQEVRKLFGFQRHGHRPLGGPALCHKEKGRP